MSSRGRPLHKPFNKIGLDQIARQKNFQDYWLMYEEIFKPMQFCHFLVYKYLPIMFISTHTVCDQKSPLFRFQKFISHFKNKFSQIFKHGKTCYRRNSPQSYCAEAGKILLSSHLQAAKFEKPFNTSNHMEYFCRQWNCLPEIHFWETQKTVKTR